MRHRHKHVKHKIKSFTPKKPFFKKRGFWAILGALVVISLVIYFLFFFEPFQVTKISVSGNQAVSAQEIETAAWHTIERGFWGLPQKNIFLVDASALESDLAAQFAQIGEISVHKGWLREITITVTERRPVATFCAAGGQENCLYIDAGGVVYASDQAAPVGNFTITQPSQTGGIAPGSMVVSKKTMEGILGLQQKLKNDFQLGISRISIENPLIVTTSEGWPIYFDLEGDMQMQTVKLVALLKDQIPAEERRSLEYIYLQYKDRAYYK